MILHRTGHRLGLVIALVLGGVVVSSSLLLEEAQAQITIEESDFQVLNGEQVAVQWFYAVNPSNLEPVMDQTGADQDFDFTPYAFELEYSGTRTQWAMSNAPSDAPCRERFEPRGANVLTRVQFEGQGAATDTTFWSYHGLSSSQQTYFGACSVLFQDVDNDGDQPDTLGITWDPAQRHRALPVNYQDAWSQQADHSPIPNTNSITTASDRDWAADAYGTLMTPAGSAAALRIRMDSEETTIAGGIQVGTSHLSSVDFGTKERRMSATIELEGDPAAITDAFYTVRAEAGQSFAVTSGTTPTLSGPSATVSFTQPSTAAGTLNVSRFDTPPINNSFAGSAPSDDGTSVTPDVLWEDHYVTVHDWGLEEFTAEVCMDLGSVSGIQEADKLVLLTRESADGAWTPLNSTLDGSQLCGTVSNFSQFAVGSNSADNPLPVEFTSFAARQTGAGAVELTWATGSETGNAGFRVQRRQEPRGRTGAWTDVGFVEGGGTTTEGQKYRFRDADLPYAADSFAYRLKQVDTDGSTHLTDPVVVERPGPQQPVLKKTTPNPARRQVTVQYAVPEDAQEVRMQLYDVLGRQVRTLNVGAKEGRHEQEIRVQGLASGVYLLRLTAGGHSQTRRLTIAR